MKRISLIALTFSITTSFNIHAGTLGIGLGTYDIDGSDSAADCRLEYESDSNIWLDKLKPWAGIQATTDGTIWLGGGLLYDWEFSDTWHLKPGVGVGYYSRGSSDLDLGYPIEFRSQLEIVKDINAQNSLGLAISHLSNADLDSENPGVEALNVYWHYRF